MDDFSEFKYQSSLKCQLYDTLFHLCGLAATEDVLHIKQSAVAILPSIARVLSELLSDLNTSHGGGAGRSIVIAFSQILLVTLH